MDCQFSAHPAVTSVHPDCQFSAHRHLGCLVPQLKPLGELVYLDFHFPVLLVESTKEPPVESTKEPLVELLELLVDLIWLQL